MTSEALRIIKFAERHHTRADSRVIYPQRVSNPVGHRSRSKRALYSLGSRGFSAMAVYHELVQVAMGCPIRGVLAHRDGPLSFAELSSLTFIPARKLRAGVEMLMRPAEGEWHPWIDKVAWPLDLQLIEASEVQVNRRDPKVTAVVRERAGARPSYAQLSDKAPDTCRIVRSLGIQVSGIQESGSAGDGQTDGRTAAPEQHDERPQVTHVNRAGGGDEEYRAAVRAVTHLSGGRFNLREDAIVVELGRWLGDAVDVGQGRSVTGYRLVQLAAEDASAKKSTSRSASAMESLLRTICKQCVDERRLPGQSVVAANAGPSYAGHGEAF